MSVNSLAREVSRGVCFSGLRDGQRGGPGSHGGPAGLPTCGDACGDRNNEDGIIAKIEFMFENMVLLEEGSL